MERRIRGGAIRAALALVAYRGDTADGPALWKQRHEIALAESDKEERLDEDPATWQRVETQLSVPPDAELLLVQVRMYDKTAGARDGASIFPAHYADDVSLRLLVRQGRSLEKNSSPPNALMRHADSSKCTILACLLAGALHGADFHVARSGKDTDAGTITAPFATLERARAAVREWRRADGNGGATVWIESGVFPITITLELTAEDSGTEASPITWRAQKDGATRLDARRRIDANAFHKVTEPTLLARMADEARGHVWALDLAANGLQHRKRPPDIFDDGGGLPDLYCNGERQTLSRWPNETKTTMERVLDRGSPNRAPGAKGGTFVFRGERPARWVEAAKADQLWLAGFWRVAWDWETVRVQIARCGASERIELAQPVPGGIGSKYAGPEGAGTEPWIALNLLEEIDQPGEWSLDFATQTLYWWPPAPLEKAEIAIADYDAPIIRLNGASHVALRGLIIEGGLGNGIEITGGESCAIEGCTLRDLGRSGVIVTGGQRHQILSCDLHTLGQSGLLIGGGDRRTLTPAGHVADNNHIHDYGLAKKVYAPGIGVGFRDQPAAAVGCRVSHNLIHHAPHAAVLYGGNDNIFEFNEIHDFLIESDDLGGFYSTFDWTSYGNIVRHNFIHDAHECARRLPRRRRQRRPDRRQHRLSHGRGRRPRWRTRQYRAQQRRHRMPVSARASTPAASRAATTRTPRC